MIRINLLSKSFGSTPVLGPMTLDISAAENVAILGPSGVGKSTLLRILAGLDQDFLGTRRLCGRLAMVLQEPTLLPWRDCVSNITLMTGASADRARKGLAEVGLEGKESQFPGQLSLGQQRRLSLARALASDPDILILDEPFASLDEQVAQEMIDLTARLIKRRGMSSILVTHSPAEARALSTRIFRLSGAPAKLEEQEKVDQKHMFKSISLVG